MSERCVVVRAGDATEGITGVTYAAGISATSAGARGLCLHVASLPPGARARPHQHERHDSAAYVIDGETVLWSGERLQPSLVARRGDFVYIPSGVSHLSDGALT
jgi:uncharacterized RmlC-like cupin family protein